MARNADRALVLVTEAVADALDVGIDELPPLSESISLDGLDSIVSERAADASVTFSYAGLRVFVHAEGLVYVRPTSESGTAGPDGGFSHVEWNQVLERRGT